MNQLAVHHLAGDRFEITVRGHVIVVDQPVSDGGEDTAPTPTELFAAGLASCVAFYVRRYLSRHGLPEDGLQVVADYRMGQRPARVAGVRIAIALPDGVPEERRSALLAVASHCTVHNSLTDPPDVEVTLGTSTPAKEPA